MALSVPWRAAQVVAIGVSPRVLALWQRLVVLSILFHHSNLRLPVRLERGLATVIVTPRLHEIHHSVFSDERNSNWSSGLTLWDRLHGTLRTGHAASAVTIGLPEYRTRREVSLARMLGAPFVAPASRAARPRAGLASSRRASGRARPGGPRAG